MNLIDDITLNGEPDTGYMRFEPHKNFLVKACYYTMNYGWVTVLGNTDIWNSLMPKNVIFLSCLPSIIGLILEKYSLGKLLFQSLCVLLGVDVIKIILIYYSLVLTLLLFDKNFSFLFTMDRIFLCASQAQGQLYRSAVKNGQQFLLLLHETFGTQEIRVFDNCNISSSRLVNNCWDMLILWAQRCKQVNRRNEIRNWAMLENRTS
jgi:hypothetical protein